MPSTPTDSHKGSFLQELLRSVTRTVCHRPWLTLFLVFLGTGASAGYTVSRLEFKTDRAALIDPRAPFHRRWLNYTASFGDEKEVVVIVEADDPDSIKTVLDELGGRMKRAPEFFTNVLYKVEPGPLPAKGLQYLRPRQLEAALAGLNEFDGVLRGQWQFAALDSVIPAIEARITATRQFGRAPDARSALLQAELLSSSLAAFMDDRRSFLSPWPELITVDRRMRAQANQVHYLLNDAGTMGFVRAILVPHTTEFTGAAEPIARLRKLIAELSLTYPSVTIGLTGIPVLESDEMQRSQSDMILASIISFFGVGVLLVLGLRGFRHPVLAMLMLAVGMAWAFGYATLAIGHLNILSVSFAAILIGLGIDFAIHFLARYLELRHQGHSIQPAILNCSGSVGPGIVTAAVTTALAFSCAALTQFLGVAELGLIAGGGIMLCCVATFVVLPALISVSDRRAELKSLPVPFQGHALRWFTSHLPSIAFLLSSVLICYVGMQAMQFENGRIIPLVRYDYNLLNLQAEGVESVEVQRRIFEQAEESLLYAVAVAQTPDEALYLRSRFEALPTVHHVEELASRLPSYPLEESQVLIQAIGVRLSRLPDTAPAFEHVNPSSIGRSLESLYQKVRSGDEPVAVRTARTMDAFLDRFELLSLSDQISLLREYQARMTGALFAQFCAIRAAANPDLVSLADLPAELTSRFVSPHGEWLVQIYPKDEIWDIDPLSRFVADVRSVDPEVTGTPVQNYEASRQMKASYEMSALYALAAISLVLLTDFLSRENTLLAILPPLVVLGFVALMLEARHLEIVPGYLLGAYLAMAFVIALLLEPRGVVDTILAMAPPLAGSVLMFGCLAMLKVNLNAANMIVLPLVLGIGVDDGVHVLHDFRRHPGPYRMSASTINAILLTSLTSMIGFGSMMISSHRGLSSLGLVLVIGVGSCLFVSLFTLPAILTLIAGRGNSASSVRGGDKTAADPDEKGSRRARTTAA